MKFDCMKHILWCTNFSSRCNLLLCDCSLYTASLDSPNDVVCVLGHLTAASVEVRSAELMLLTITIYSPAVGLATSKVYSIVDT